MLFSILAWRTRVPRVSDMFLSSSPRVIGYGSVCHEPLPITNISSRFFRRWGKGCHFRFRAPANHLASTFLPAWSGEFVRATRCHPSQVTVNSNSSHPTSIVSVGYHVTVCSGLVSLFNDMSTIVGHLIPKPFF